MKLTQPSLSSPSTPVVSALALAASSELGLVRSGLVAEYRFNEGSGQVLHDYSGNNNHATFGADSASGVDDPTPNSYGHYLVTDDYFTLPPSVGNFMCGAPGATVIFVSNRGAPWSNHELTELVNGSNTTRFRIRYVDDNTIMVAGRSVAADSLQSITTTTTYTTTDYRMITGIINPAQASMSIYVDNSLVKHTTGISFGQTVFDSTTTADTYRFRIGAGSYASPNNHYHGTISYALYYNRALSQLEITQIYNYLSSHLLTSRGVDIKN
jgi:hypothetical protein